MSDLWLLSLEGDRTPQPFLRTRFREQYPTFSPNGRFIAYVSDEPGYDSIYLSRFPEPTGRWQIAAEPGTQPRWNPNGRELFFRSGDELMVVDVATEGELVLGKPRTLFEWPWPSTFDYALYDVAPDGNRFVMLKDRESLPPPRFVNLVLSWPEELRRLVSSN